MTVRSRFGTIAHFSVALALALFLFAHQAKAQKYDDDGQEPGATQEDDGFRPVWAQQQATSKAKTAAHQVAKPAAKNVQVAEQQPTVPVRTETTVYDRWTVTCQETLDNNAKKTCSATLRVVDQNKQLVILWRLANAADGKLTSVMQTPTGVLVQKGVDLNVGDKAVGKFAYAGCVPQNCEAAGAVDDPLLKAIMAAPEMMVTIHAMDGRDVHFKFPLSGIDKAVAAVRS
jgi:invasion protein IalB